MDLGGCSSGGGPCYYSVLGIGRNAPASEVRAAYRKLAMKWHPDRWTRDPAATADAKKRFQRIQEAYSVLSDDGKRAMYDIGLYDPLEEEDEGFSDFMQEMLSMMDNVKSEKQESFEDLQRMFADLVNADGMDFGSNGFHGGTRREPSDDTRKRSKVAKRGGSNVSDSAVRC